MDLWIAVAVAVISYLVGSLSFARIVYRLITRKNLEDLELVSDKTGQAFRADSISASTVGAALGKRMGMFVSLLDIVKAAVVVLPARLLFPGQVFYLVAAVFVLLGHIFPVYYHFQGSGGFTVMLGSLLLIDWPAAIILPIAGPLIGLVLLRSLPLAFILWVPLLVVWMWLRGAPPPYLWYAVATNVVFIAGMAPQALRILRQRRAGQSSVGNAWVDSTPMGRGFVRMAKFFKVNIPD